MMIRFNSYKLYNNLFLYKSLVNNKLLKNNFILNEQKYYSKQINNNNNKCLNSETNNNNNNKSKLISDIYKYKEESLPFITSLKSLSIDEIESQAKQENFLHLNNDLNRINSEWFETLSFAERVVNYPTSFLSLRFLLKDEISYLAIHLKRIIDTKHPLLKTAKNILSTYQQIRGLIVLLLSKSYSYPKHILDNFDSETNRSALINKHQRKLAEITDMIHVSQVLHRGIIDLPFHSNIKDSQFNEDLHLGNTISILIGDFLLANSSRGLAMLRNPSITGFVAKAIGNYSEAEFLRLELSQNNNFKLLEKYCYLSGGSLLANCCKSAVLLAEYDQQIQCQAFELGKHIGISFQLSELLHRFATVRSNNNNNNNHSNNSNNMDNRNELFDLNSVKSLLELNTKKALNLIENLDKSEASLALTKIVLNIENVEYVDEY